MKLPNDISQNISLLLSDEYLKFYSPCIIKVWKGKTLPFINLYIQYMYQYTCALSHSLFLSVSKILASRSYTISTARLTGTSTKLIPIKMADEKVPILNSSGCEVCWKGCVFTVIGSNFILISGASILQQNKGNKHVKLQLLQEPVLLLFTLLELTLRCLNVNEYHNKINFLE